jgi:hypothetical protein
LITHNDRSSVARQGKAADRDGRQIGGSVRAHLRFVLPPTIKVLPSAQSGESGYLCTTAGTGNFRICREAGCWALALLEVRGWRDGRAVGDAVKAIGGYGGNGVMRCVVRV